jgi:molecular chaperone GrpE (heat shock protein)
MTEEPSMIESDSTAADLPTTGSALADEPATVVQEPPLEPPPESAQAQPDPEPEPDPEAHAAPEAQAEPHAELPPAEDHAARTVAVLERLEDRLEESQRLLARQSEIASSLHAENQRLKAGELRGALLPLVRDILRVHDDLKQIIRAELDAGADPETMQRDPLHIGVEQIVDALARNGIERTPVDAGDAFDPRLHKVVAVAAAESADAHRTVADVLKSGFAWDDGAPIRAADVRVFKHTPAPVADEPAAPASDAIEAQP